MPKLEQKLMDKKLFWLKVLPEVAGSEHAEGVSKLCKLGVLGGSFFDFPWHGIPGVGIKMRDQADGWPEFSRLITILRTRKQFAEG